MFLSIIGILVIIVGSFGMLLNGSMIILVIIKVYDYLIKKVVYNFVI